MRWFDSTTKPTNMSLRKFQETVKDREAWCSAVRGVAQRVTNDLATEQQQIS